MQQSKNGPFDRQELPANDDPSSNLKKTPTKVKSSIRLRKNQPKTKSKVKPDKDDVKNNKLQTPKVKSIAAKRRAKLDLKSTPSIGTPQFGAKLRKSLRVS